MRPFCLSLLVLFVTLVPFSVQAAVYVVHADQDSWLKEAAPTENHGIDQQLFSKNTPGDNFRAVFRFDLSSIPPTEKILSATAMFYVTGIDPSGDPVNLYRVNDNWTEGGVTWSNAANDYDNSTVYGSLIPLSIGMVTADITALVQEWTEGTHLNQGLMFISTSLDLQSNYASKESPIISSQPALLVVTDEGPMRMMTGSYMGDNAVDHLITDVGFKPDLVIIKGNLDLPTVARTSTMIGNVSKPLGLPVGLRPDMIKSLDSEGFTVGWDPHVNFGGVEYFWIAFRAGPGEMFVGSYAGNATDNWSINDVGFQPDYLMVMSEGNEHAVHRFPTQTGDATLQFDPSDQWSNRIQAFLPNGFVVGDDPTVNGWLANHHYVAWKSSPGKITGNEYIGTGNDNTNINGVGFEPEYLIIKRHDISFAARHRPASLTGDNSFRMEMWSAQLNYIQDFLPDGFQVGDHFSVNEAGEKYFWMAFRDNPVVDLSVVKDVDIPAPIEGDTISYNITITNNGPNSATGIELLDNLPSGVTYITDTPDQGTYASATGVWEVGSIANGATVGLTITAKVDLGTGGTIINNMAVIFKADQADTSNANDIDAAKIDVQHSEFKVKTGSYAGDGSGLQSITDIGFQPDFVIIKGDNNEPAVARSRTMIGDATKELGTNSVILGNLITSLDLDGFSVGSGNQVNDPGVMYYWIAFQESPDYMVTGRYAGDGQDDRDITDVGFQPGYVIVMSEANEDAMQRFASEIPDKSLPFNASDEKNDRIQDFLVNSFQVGKHNTVNEDKKIFHYVAWKTTPGRIQEDTYNGNQSDNHKINSVGFRPDYLIISRANNGSSSVHRPASLEGDSTLLFEPGPLFSDGIQAFQPVGFEIGTLDAVNKNSEIYYYAAFRDLPSLDLLLTKNVNDSTPNEGDTLTFRIALTNTGPEDATGIEVVDLLPSGLTFVSDSTAQGSYTSGTGMWNVGGLANGANAFLDVIATVDSGTGGSTIINKASIIAADQADSNSTNDADSAMVTVKSSDLSITKIADNISPNEADTVTYTIKLTNNGPEDATSIEVTDLLPGGITYVSDSTSQGTYASGSGLWSVGTVADADSAFLILTTIVDGGTSGSAITNTASVTKVDQADPDSTNNSDSAIITMQSSDLAMNKIVNDLAPNEGDTLTYSITLTNDGPSTATGVEVTDLLPAGVTYLSDSTSQGSFVNGTGKWTIGTVADADSVTLLLSATVDTGTAGTIIPNEAAVTAAEQADPDSTNNIDSVLVTVVSADLELAKMVNDSTPNEDDIITYAITLTNNGPDTATGISITDLLPAGVTYVSHSLSQGSYSSGTGVWTVGLLSNAASAALTISARINAGTGGATITNTAAIASADQADPNSGDNSAAIDIIVQSADLAIDKIVDGPTPSEGDTLSFTITLTNAGPDSATDIEVSDILPAGVTYLSDTPSQGSYINGTGLWNVGTVSKADSATLVITTRVDAGSGGSTITNIAGITSADQADPDTTNNTGSAGTTIQSADLSLKKIASNPNPNEADTLHYTLILTNNGPNAATGVEITDLLPAGVSFVSASSTQGSYTDVSGLWTAGTVAIGDTASLLMTVTIDTDTGGSTIINGASITSADQTDPDNGNNNDTAVIIVKYADLAIQKIVDLSAPNEGDTITYTVTLTNNGPDNTTGVEVTDLLPDGVTYVSDTPSQGSYASATGQWLAGTVNNTGSATLDITAVVDTGTVDSTIANTASITTGEVADPDESNNSDTAEIMVVPRLSLQDAPNSLYPPTAFVDDPELALRIGIDNESKYGVMLNTISSIKFTDGIKTYAAKLGNPTYIPPEANNFIITFLPQAMPVGISAPASYDLELLLGGVDDNANVYGDTISTAGRNSLYIDIPRIIISAAELGMHSVYPGAIDRALLAIQFENQYPDGRYLDTLVVTNTSVGNGSQSNLDSECSSLSIYDDVDGDEVLSPADTLIANSSFASGRAVFYISSNFAIPAESSRFLFVTTSIDSFTARDGDHLNAAVISPFDVQFAGDTEIEDNFSPLDPIDSFGYLVVDGMVAYQITLIPSPLDTLISSTTDNLIVTAIFPSNGYEGDSLSALAIKDISGDFYPGDFSALKLYRDTGDLSFDPASDLYLGELVFSGDRYEISGVREPISSGERFFVSVDVSTYPNNGDHFRPSIPVGGVEVISSNDGPVDASVSSDSTYAFRQIEQIEIVNVPLADQLANPGDANVSLLLMRIKNNTVAPITLDSLSATNVSTGAGVINDLDGEFYQIKIYSDDGNGLVDNWDELLSGGIQFNGGSLVARNIDKTLSVGQTTYLLFACDIDSVCTSDGDKLAIQIPSAGSLYFDQPKQIDGDFPVSTSQEIIIDGMVSFQIHVYPATDSVIITGSNDILVFDFSIPTNGYQIDTLTSVQIYNQGSANSEHFFRLSLYADGGDGSFDHGTGDDTFIDDFVYLGGKSYLLPGLKLPLLDTCSAGRRLYVAADLHTAYSTGATIQYEIPMNGVKVTSANDGPIDTPALDPTIRIIPKPNELTVFPYSLKNKRVHPGARRILNFGVGFYNGYSSTFTLEKIKLFQEGTAVHNEIHAVCAYEDADIDGLFDPLTDNLLTEAIYENSYYVMDDLELQLSSKKITYLFIAYDLELDSRDSVSINLQMNSNEHITLSNESIEIQGEFPINSPGIDFTDGMVTAQIDVDPSPTYQAALGEEDVLCLAFTIPANGALTDILQSITILNTGTALPLSDITILKLWTEDGGDPVRFTPADDRLLSFLSWNGNAWQNPAELTEMIPISGLRCYVTFSVSITATDGSTMTGRIPLSGIQVMSANDGPIDAMIDNPFEQLISTAPLLTSVSADRSSYSIGQGIQISMRVRNAGETVLSAISTSDIEISGSGVAAYQSGPSIDSFDLAPKSDTTIVWQYSAISAGDLELCGFAHTGDSLKVSRRTCAAIDLQKKPQNIIVSLSDLSPTSANRGQQNVPLFNIGCAHMTSDSLVASIIFDGFDLYFENASGGSLPPNSILHSLSLVNPEGGQYNFALADSSSNPVSVQLTPPILVLPGESLRLDAFCRIAEGASFTSFRLSMESIMDIRVEDSNDAALAPISSSVSFPWVTNEIDINAPAESLLVSASSEGIAYSNLDQNEVLAFNLYLLNSGNLVTASELLTHLTFSFFDSAGVSIPPGAVIQKLSLASSEGIIYETDEIPSHDHELMCDLVNPLVLQPQNERILGVLLDLRALPQEDAFYLTVEAPLHIIARDFNTGHLIEVAPRSAASAFPLKSSTIIFQSPASGIDVSYNSMLPNMILPADPSVPVMEIILTHVDTVSASSIELDSLVVVFKRAGGEPLIPGEYFSHMYLINGGDTLSFNSSLSSSLPMAELKIHPPLVLAKSAEETIRVYLGTKNLYSPATFEARIEKDHLFLFDSNDDSRFYYIDGQFPLTSDLGTMQLPSTQALVGMDSKIPGNITSTHSDLHAFDMFVRNGNPQGSTDIEMRRLAVTLENSQGDKHAPLDFVSAAYLRRGDSTICEGEFNNSAITFLIAEEVVRVEAGSTDTLSFHVDIETQLAGKNIRFVIEENSSIEIFDGITSGTISVGTIISGGFPLRTNSAHILSSDIEKAFTNYPNPFAAGSEQTRITFYLESQSHVTLKVYTIWGAPVINLLSDRLLPPGLHQNIAWNGKNSDGDTVNNGVYYLVLEIRAAHGGKQSLKRKVGVIR